jgi:hypothetical protein
MTLHSGPYGFALEAGFVLRVAMRVVLDAGFALRVALDAGFALSFALFDLDV